MIFRFSSRCLVFYILIGIIRVCCKKLQDDRRINVLIEDCNLHLNYSIPNETTDCLPVGYRVKIYEGARLLVNTHTNTPDYVYSDIHSNFRYRVQVDPIFICSNSSTFFGASSEQTVSTIPEKLGKNIKANESENLTLVCPVYGAYETVGVEWQHMVGLNDLVVREFTSKRVHLSNLTYQDWGKYSCTVKYKECGKRSVRELTTYISLLVYGPPFISSMVRNFKGKKEEDIELMLSLVSFPYPSRLVELKNIHGIVFLARNITYVAELVLFEVYGVNVEVPGYSAKVDVSEVLENWIEAAVLTIFVSNKMGYRSKILTINGERPDSSDLSAWIEDCSLHVNVPKYTGIIDCKVVKFRLRLCQNNVEYLTVDFTGLKYSYVGIDSNSLYHIEITPTLLCTNKSQVSGKTLEKNLSAVPGTYIKHISERQSENLTIVCPLNGAYEFRGVTWHHTMGTEDTVVRSFSSLHINLNHITYKDMGKYVCYVNYTSCRLNSKTIKQLTGKVYLSISGSPRVTIIKTHEDTSRKTFDFLLNVVSFPKPDNLIQIRKEDGFVLFERSANFDSSNVPLYLVDKVVEVQGYSSNLTVTNITDQWYGRNTIVISNKLGSHAHAFTLEKSDQKSHKSNVDSIAKHFVTLSTIGASFTFLCCMFITLWILIKRKSLKQKFALKRKEVRVNDKRKIQTRSDSYEEPVNTQGISPRNSDYTSIETYMEME